MAPRAASHFTFSPTVQFGSHKVGYGAHGLPIDYPVRGCPRVTEQPGTTTTVSPDLGAAHENRRPPASGQDLHPIYFASVDATATTNITVHGTASIGAMIFLDTGSPAAIAVTNNGGNWTFAVSQTQQLGIARRGGWVYFMAQKGTAKEFFRVQILGGLQEKIDPTTLPSDSPLRGQ